MFQTNKVGPVNDHSTITKKPIGLKTSYNNSGTLPRDHTDSSGIGNLERDNREHRERERDRQSSREIGAGQKIGHSTGQLKRSPSFSTSMSTGNSHHIQHGPPPTKKHKVTSARDTSIAEVGKYGSLNDYAFFDKVNSRLPQKKL